MDKQAISHAVAALNEAELERAKQLQKIKENRPMFALGLTNKWQNPDVRKAIYDAIITALNEHDFIKTDDPEIQKSIIVEQSRLASIIQTIQSATSDRA